MSASGGVGHEEWELAVHQERRGRKAVLDGWAPVHADPLAVAFEVVTGTHAGGKPGVNELAVGARGESGEAHVGDGRTSVFLGIDLLHEFPEVFLQIGFFPQLFVRRGARDKSRIDGVDLHG